MNNRYTFSGHESFSCKSLWLKKGYEFVVSGKDFNSPDAVIDLGVGKNMVSSIRYWLKAFALIESDRVTPFATYIFDSEIGKDPYIEDLGTLWLLHFHLVNCGEATLYNWFFTKFQKEHIEFNRLQIQNFVHRNMIEADKEKLYNSNTIKKDIAVLLLNYLAPERSNSSEDYSALLLDLDLISTKKDELYKTYLFNLEGKRNIAPEIFLYAILKASDNQQTIPFDLLQDLGHIFCMTPLETIDMMQSIAFEFPNEVSYSDVAGIRQIQFIKEITPKVVLDKYYNNANV
jgi:hypothetical protein